MVRIPHGLLPMLAQLFRQEPNCQGHTTVKILPVPNIQHPSPNTQHPTPNTQHPSTFNPQPSTFNPQPSPITYKAFFRINRDIFFRTLCMVCVMMFFTSAGSWQGEVVLAVNTLLMQLYLLVSYIMDGFANAGEALSGKFYGAGDNDALRTTVRRIFFWGMITAVAFTVTYIAGGKHFLRLLTDEPSVVEASTSYVWWAYLIPIAGVAAFVWDGVFIGVTASRGMLISAAVAAGAFFVGVIVLMPFVGNHGLWVSMLLFLVMRGVVQTWLFCNRIAKNAI